MLVVVFPNLNHWFIKLGEEKWFTFYMTYIFFLDGELNAIKNWCMAACKKKALRAANFEVRLFCLSDNKVNQIQFLEASLGKFCT